MLCLTLAACTPPPAGFSTIPRPVKILRITTQAHAHDATYAGEVEPRYHAVLSFRVPGKIVDRQVNVGDIVKKGQLLAALDETDYHLSLRNLQARLASAQAEHRYAVDDLVRYGDLRDRNVISAHEYGRNETTLKVVQARVKALEIEVAQARNQLGYTRLHADRDGVITALGIESGQVVVSGQPIVRLAQLDEKEIHIDIPEHRIKDIRQDQEATVSLWANPQYRITGRVREIAGTADTASRTYRVKVALPQAQDQVHLGMSGSVTLSATPVEKIGIPLSALFSPHDRPDEVRVWLVDIESATVRSQLVKTGRMLGDQQIEVERGLDPGQTLVTAGAHRLIEGQRICIADESQSAGNFITKACRPS
ncbi:efflux RND transporter periplasmic adaptor subunit [Nitrosovibrio sp. Nv17]|uniref:efflux RND transporter periplasmic adaptor subunit n=1 Tax=Nitrosovibrio sp. Nv17 TaxID=1855339 RepID=UPI000908D4CE|nr:efflux RND transporter periplasmic adaptor subunit [Nitrosovibrio sp. Nv17]SFW27139.1 membrane fusion protein, multidrug efflux system [Nitrosovibrio sp. Nv17]